MNETEFYDWVKRIQSLRQDAFVVDDDPRQDFIAAFRVFDSDKNGFITKVIVPLLSWRKLILVISSSYHNESFVLIICQTFGIIIHLILISSGQSNHSPFRLMYNRLTSVTDERNDAELFILIVYFIRMNYDWLWSW